MKRYEQAIRVVTAFFSVLLGFGLKRLLDSSSFSPGTLVPCFLMSVFIFLRFLLGSANHMWFEFVRLDLAQDSKYKARRGQVLNDFGFLVVFGLIGMAICYSNNLEEFLERNLLLTFTGLIWVGIYALVGVVVGAKNRQGPIPRGNWGYWGWVNLVQFLAVVVVYLVVAQWPSSLLSPGWPWPLAILVVVYLFVLIYDLVKQLEILEKDIPATQ